MEIQKEVIGAFQQGKAFSQPMPADEVFLYHAPCERL